MQLITARPRYIRWLRATKDLSPHTVRAYEGDLSSFERHVGPNRKVFLGYRHDSFQIGRAVHYFSRAKIKFKINRGRLSNGDEIKMRGRLPGPRAAGRVAIVEAAALHSHTWYPFGEGTTNRNGVFHIRYPFDETSVTTIYKIRAVAPRQRGWPWEGGRSKPVLVEVRG